MSDLTFLDVAPAVWEKIDGWMQDGLDLDDECTVVFANQGLALLPGCPPAVKQAVARLTPPNTQGTKLRQLQSLIMQVDGMLEEIWRIWARRVCSSLDGYVVDDDDDRELTYLCQAALVGLTTAPGCPVTYSIAVTTSIISGHWDDNTARVYVLLTTLCGYESDS